MASSVSLGYPLWCDGQQWTSLLSRQLDGGAAVWDTNASATAVHPLGGVFPGPGSPLLVTQQASPNMSVLVNAGYCAVPHPTQGHGTYLFGLLAQGTLTVTANSSGSARVDIVVARVNDLGNSSSSCDVEIIAGTPGAGQPATPSACLLLAAVAVANGASSITTANITDKRTKTVAPGGILPAATGAAPPLEPGQLVYNTTAGRLQLPGGAADLTDINTSAGGTGLNPGSGSASGWGIGYGSATIFFPFSSTDGQVVSQISEQFTADGTTDYQISAKWGLAVPEAAVDSASPSIPHGQCRIILAVDGVTVDTVYLNCAASGGVTKPGQGGSYAYYTSAILGSTPAAGTHVATLAVETLSTASGSFSGAHIGDLASVAAAGNPFGSVAAGFISALTAENCSLRVAAIAASTI